MSQAMAHWTKDNQEGLESHEVAGLYAAVLTCFPRNLLHCVDLDLGESEG